MLKSQADKEKAVIANKLRDFDMRTSRAYQYLIQKFGTIPSREELTSLAMIIESELNIRLDREERRRKIVLIFWYDKNFDKIKPFIENRIIVKQRRIL